MGWRAGWYVATVHNYCTIDYRATYVYVSSSIVYDCMDTDMITLMYQSEPNNPYEQELTPLIAEGKIKLIWSPI